MRAFLTLAYVLENGRLVLELGQNFLGRRLGKGSDGLVLLDVAVDELPLGIHGNLKPLACGLDDPRLAGLEAEPGHDEVAQLVDGQAPAASAASAKASTAAAPTFFFLVR